VTGEGLKPLATSQTPSENFHGTIGRALIAVSADTCGQRPKQAIEQAEIAPF